VGGKWVSRIGHQEVRRERARGGEVDEKELLLLFTS
jgi:hypothetical protein